jgi:hypothetical protein
MPYWLCTSACSWSVTAVGRPSTSMATTTHRSPAEFTINRPVAYSGTPDVTCTGWLDPYPAR